jgi:nickel-type superoxide dismutase maturation protease
MRFSWAALLAIGAAVAARRWLDVVRVRGRSMAPTLLPGDRLLVARLAPRAGDIVLARDPRDPGRELIKRVARLDGGAVTLRGDNPIASTDARSFGAVPTPEWRAVARYWPPARIGAIPSPQAPLVMVDEGGEPACSFPEALVAG